ncbi:hypothetical protein BC567DRAFT_227320 [Phyllosticta citribraziliensis]
MTTGLLQAACALRSGVVLESRGAVVRSCYLAVLVLVRGKVGMSRSCARYRQVHVAVRGYSIVKSSRRRSDSLAIVRGYKGAAMSSIMVVCRLVWQFEKWVDAGSAGGAAPVPGLERVPVPMWAGPAARESQSAQFRRRT